MVSLSWNRHIGWEPQGGQRKPWCDLAPGDLIELRREVWRVLEVRPVPTVDWDEDDREHWEIDRDGWKISDEEQWPRRPLAVVFVPPGGGQSVHKRIRPWATHRDAYVLPEHYPVCRDCGQLYPCRELDIAAAVERESAALEKLEKILPGCCWCCKEPVSRRQKAICFDGENLLLPGREAPVFHLRAACLDGARRYERRWVPAVSGRQWRLQCPGTLILHVDGDECTELAGCAGPDAYHRDNHSHVYFRYEYEAGGRRTMFRGYAGFGSRCLRCTDAVARGEDEVPYREPPPPGALL